MFDLRIWSEYGLYILTLFLLSSRSVSSIQSPVLPTLPYTGQPAVWSGTVLDLKSSADELTLVFHISPEVIRFKLVTFFWTQNSRHVSFIIFPHLWGKHLQLISRLGDSWELCTYSLSVFCCCCRFVLTSVLFRNLRHQVPYFIGHLSVRFSCSWRVPSILELEGRHWKSISLAF